MVSLIDIAPLKHTVTIQGKNLDVSGLTANGIAAILFTFPEIRKIISGVGDRETAMALVARFPEAVSMIIAVGTGAEADDETSRAAAARLSLGDQFTILEAIIKVSFPQTLKSFLDGVAALVNQSGGRGWGQGTTSPAPSSGALQQEGANETAGTAPQSS